MKLRTLTVFADPDRLLHIGTVAGDVLQVEAAKQLYERRVVRGFGHERQRSRRERPRRCVDHVEPDVT